MLEKIQEHIHRNRLFEKNDRVLLAISGGIDSMVMLHAFQSLGVSFGVAHCNFQLREEESNSDERFVQAYCEQAQISFFSTRFDTNNYAIRNGFSIQMAARALRYLWFEEILNQHGFRYLATAHHLNDSLETSLINLTRGTGHKGISGIAVKNGQRIRPMLSVTRKEIESYAALNGITWREDQSNQTNDYQRNVVRHEILPRLHELNPSLENAFHQFAERMKGTDELATLGLQAWKEKFWSEGEIIKIKKTGLHDLRFPAPVLYALLKDFGFNLEQCFEMVEAILLQPGKVFLSEHFQLVVDREELVLTKQPVLLDTYHITTPNETVNWGGLQLTLTVTTDVKLETSSSVAFLDAEKIQWPLTLRSWRKGDYFYPLGMNHKKKLSDFFIDTKISIAEKSNVAVLESRDEICWVVGHRIDDRFKVTPASQRVLVVRAARV